MKHHSSHTGTLLQQDEDDWAEADGLRMPKGASSFPGAHYFDEIMHEKIRPRKLTKFRAQKSLDGDL